MSIATTELNGKRWLSWLIWIKHYTNKSQQLCLHGISRSKVITLDITALNWRFLASLTFVVARQTLRINMPPTQYCDERANYVFEMLLWHSSGDHSTERILHQHLINICRIWILPSYPALSERDKSIRWYLQYYTATLTITDAAFCSTCLSVLYQYILSGLISLFMRLAFSLEQSWLGWVCSFVDKISESSVENCFL